MKKHNSTPVVLNMNNLDIHKPEAFAQFVASAKELQGQLELAWGAVQQQMLDRNVNKLKGDWGTIQFIESEQLVVTDAESLDPAVTKPSLDTAAVRAYRELYKELPAGVGSKTITKFDRRIKKV